MAKDEGVCFVKKRNSFYDFSAIQFLSFAISVNCSTSSIQILLLASLGILQSPRGERLTLPTFGPSGIQLRLNCCAKKRQ